jgi:hypothetical protein
VMGRVGRGYIVKFPHPMHFCLRRAKERSIRTRPSTASPRNFFFLLSFLTGDPDISQAGACSGGKEGKKKKIQRTFRRWPCVMVRRLDQRAKGRTIRTRPSTAGPRNFFFFAFLLNRRPRHQSMAIDGRAESKKAE